jgi:hypothetical protein
VTLWKNLELDRPQMTIYYGTCTLHARYLRLQTHIHRVCNTYWFSVATMVMWTLITVTLCLHCLSNYINSLKGIYWFTLEFDLWWSYIFVELCVLTVLCWMHEIIKEIKFEFSAAISLFFLVQSFEIEYFVCMSYFARCSMQHHVVHISVCFLITSWD